MAKYARLSDGDPADGRFEIVSIPHRGRFRLLLTGLRAAWKGLGWQPSARRLRFRTLDQELPLQLDGEVVKGTFGRGYTATTGSLDSKWVDVTANSVTGAVTVVRRSPAAPAAQRLTDASAL